MANNSEVPRKNKEKNEEEEEDDDEYDIKRFTKNAYYLLNADSSKIYDENYFLNTNTMFSFFFSVSFFLSVSALYSLHVKGIDYYSIYKYSERELLVSFVLLFFSSFGGVLASVLICKQQYISAVHTKVRDN
ncbi:hypothetical protein PP707_03655 [Acetobacter pasteurianus]|nr:hypothetical protein [Acetobacter pasteurianus]